MSVRLETDQDRSLEEISISRITARATPGTTVRKLPDLSMIDYFLTSEDQITAGIEIKTRKESVEQIRSYGGLMLKHRKLIEMQQLAEMLRIPCLVAFCFENAAGPIALVDARSIADLLPEAPPRRRNFRDLACDEELVVYLDWDRHLIWL